MQDIIPGSLLDKRKADDFLAWLTTLRLDPEDKRNLLQLWADRVGVKISGGIITRVLPERR